MCPEGFGLLPLPRSAAHGGFAGQFPSPMDLHPTQPDDERPSKRGNTHPAQAIADAARSGADVPFRGEGELWAARCHPVGLGKEVIFVQINGQTFLCPAVGRIYIEGGWFAKDAVELPLRLQTNPRLPARERVVPRGAQIGHKR